MIAEVYPFIRLPRAKKVFDYLIPEGLEIARGNFVTIPYRTKTIWGIVKRVKDKPPRGIELKHVASVSHLIKLREEELSFFEQIADELIQSPASVLYATIPTPPKRARKNPYESLSWLPLTLPRSEAEHVVRIVQTIEARGKAFIQTPDLRRSAAIILGYLQKNPDQKIMILVPTINDVRRLRAHITGYSPLIITGEETKNERFHAWNSFREMKQAVLIGTRTAVFALDCAINAIFVLRSGDQNYKQCDRNPRFDTRDLVWKYQQIFATKIFHLDVAPRPDSIHRFHENECLSWGSYPDVVIANLRQEQSASESPHISYTALCAIQEALLSNQKVLCVMNRKGIGSDLQCKECSYHFSCQQCHMPFVAFSHTLECLRCRKKEPIALHCPVCRGATLRIVSPGNLEIAKELERLFPGKSIRVCDKEHGDVPDGDIIVATSYYFETYVDPFRVQKFGTVIHLSVDMPLYDAKPTAIEDLERDIWQWSWFAFSSRAKVVLQTASVDLVERCISEPFLAAKEELEAKRLYQLPPYFQWFRITLKEEDTRAMEMAMTQLRTHIESIPNSIAHPLTWTKEEYAVIDCGIPSEDVRLFHALFSSLPDRYIIDTSVFS